MSKKAKADTCPRFRQNSAWAAERALRSFIHNSNRMAGVLASHSEEEVTAKFVALAISGTDLERKIARARLKDFND